MNEYQIKIYPNKSLRADNRELAPAEIRSEKITKLTKQMFELLYQADGVGLAAPQIGVNLQMTVIDPRDGTKPAVFFNPRIIKTSYSKESREEGCLSLPGLFGLIKRPRLVTVEYLDEQGDRKILKAEVFMSRVLQHEIDHLNGVLIIDHTDKFTSGEKLLQDWKTGKTPQLNISYPHSYQ